MAGGIYDPTLAARKDVQEAAKLANMFKKHILSHNLGGAIICGVAILTTDEMLARMVEAEKLLQE